MSITLYGASDDLIVIEGDINEEFPYRDLDDLGDIVAFSDGTAVRIVYDEDGIWRIRLLNKGDAFDWFVQVPADESEGYSDQLAVDEAVWVVHRVGWAS